MNGLSVCLDEIALEGLDGITLSKLWTRLTRLWSTLDQPYKAFLWRSIKISRDIQAYLLAEPRQESAVDVGNKKNKINTDVIIDNQEDGIRGCSLTYHTRVTVDVSPSSLEDVEKTYGNRLILVASQIMRENALFSPEFDSSYEISSAAYCLLEWIGKARNSGRQQCKGMNCFGMEHSTVFHHIRKLNELKLITKQKISTTGNSLTSVLYLTRFHVDHIDDRLANTIYNAMDKTASKSMSVSYLCNYLLAPKTSILKSLSLLLDKGHVVKCDGLSEGSTVDISSTISEPDDHFKVVKPFYNLLPTDHDKENESNYLEGDDDEDGIVTFNIAADLPAVNYVLKMIENYGVEGITTIECSKIFGITFYNARSILRQLEQLQKLTIKFEDVESTRRARFISVQKLQEEQEKSESQNITPTPAITNSVVDTVEPQETIATSPITDNINNELVNRPVLTEKAKKRRQLIIDYLQDHKVVIGSVKLRHYITAFERKNGFPQKIDKRTMNRILANLSETGMIHLYEMDCEVKGEILKMEVITDKTVAKDGPDVVSEIEAYKVNQMMKENLTENITDINSRASDMKEAVQLGYLPKMPRTALIHQFLYFMVYELGKPDVDMDALHKKFEWTKHFSPSDCIKGYGEGWFTPSSIFLLLPLSIYVKVMKISSNTDVIKQYLSDPSTQHLPIRDLPVTVNQKLYQTKYTRPIFLASFCILANINLITPTNKAKYRFDTDIVCHLNSKASILDTRIPSRSEIIHEFRSLDNVTDYWNEVCNICLTSHTISLAKSSTTSFKRGGSLRSAIKDENTLHSSMKPFGDGLGPAGLDSGLFAQMRRNWTWIKSDPKKRPPMIILENCMNDEEWSQCFETVKVSAKSVRKQTGGKGMKRKKNKNAQADEPASKKVKDATNEENHADMQTKSATGSDKHFLRKYQKPKKIRKRKSMMKAKLAIKRAHWTRKLHDKRDQDADKQRVFRVKFTPQEQKLLFICTLALRLLGKKSTDTGYLDWLWTRDVLYKDDYEAAKTKTAISINRKYRNMLSDPQTRTNLSICIADCKQDDTFEPFLNLGKTCDEPTFNQLVELLKKKYSIDKIEARPLCLPRTIKMFQQQYNVPLSHMGKPATILEEQSNELQISFGNTYDGVRYGILRNSIVSTLLLEDDTYDPNITFTFLNQFREEQLVKVLTDLKKKNLVSKKRTRRCDRTTSSAFSETLSVNGKRLLDANFCAGVIEEAHKFYQHLRKGALYSKGCRSEEKSASHPDPGDFLSEGNLIGGRIAAVLSLLASENLSVVLKIPASVLRIEDDRDEKRIFPAAPTTIRGSEPFTDVLNGIEDHLFGIYGQSQREVSHNVNFQSGPLFNCSFTTHDVDTNMEGLSVKNTSVPKKTASAENYNKKVLAYRKAGVVIHSAIQTNLCDIQLSIIEPASPVQCHNPEDAVAKYFFENKRLLPDQLEDCLAMCSQKFGYTGEQCQALLSVFQCIEESKDIGVTYRMIEQSLQGSCDILSKLSLPGLLRILEVFKQIYIVGHVDVRYVSKDFKETWLLPLPNINAAKEQSRIDNDQNTIDGGEKAVFSCETQTDDISSVDQNVSLPLSVVPISQPWFCMDGKLNKTAYNRLHESVLRYVLRYPGAEEHAITKHFADIMFPATLQNILQILEKHQCITKRTFIKKEKASLFSTSDAANSEKHKMNYYLPALDAITRLSDFVFKM